MTDRRKKPKSSQDQARRLTTHTRPTSTYFICLSQSSSKSPMSSSSIASVTGPRQETFAERVGIENDAEVDDSAAGRDIEKEAEDDDRVASGGAVPTGRRSVRTDFVLPLLLWGKSRRLCLLYFKKLATPGPSRPSTARRGSGKQKTNTNSKREPFRSRTKTTTPTCTYLNTSPSSWSAIQYVCVRMCLCI